ncbi:alpha/beta fold hydrolase [Tenacibaculum maritimum]|uniref:alpha/beta fold hydrolase n=1 Tax=Tenacibaculum maritimum TaxID=107401 RepID=UPI000418A775|nr:alpha/beta hydrolase [Tenacibaculum maritimum]MCD9563730.1 alpha/beta hydrolase [Tenacibaculum maritimum]MCD9566324.1 alpha/beta hydrolase [Tenacibaculum maritimum]MCD9579685.1 alpha/beta hydrolase [Tenacibaculum maritimum]MCD9581967.1 alpha/beta hydrolase [Tenacibaculum maritimum]MCD9596895.1 alpha/beta hydrolase [Tenacibaculum maritimum]
MTEHLKTEGKFTYAEAGEGQPIIVLHGLMGALSNFDKTFHHFSQKGYKVLIPELPLYTLPLLKTNVKNLAKFLHDFITFKQLKNVVLLGNSLGGHIGLYYTKHHKNDVGALVLTGSSGLYENSMGDSYPKRGDKEYVANKTRDVFYDPEIVTNDLIDEVYNVINDRSTLIRTLAIAKSAIRHNMAKDLPEMKQPTCLIWGKQDNVTPPEVADDFNKLLPDSDLFWIDKCGHAAMMERPEEFNQILENWFTSRNI